MPRLETTQNAFIAGEWSPLMLGRSDLPRYQNAASTIENALVLIQGGVRRRPGSKFIAEVKDSTKKCRLVPFVFSNTQSYVIELGNLYGRFYTQDARIESPPGTPVEVVTPWADTDLVDLEWAQYADTAFFVHPNFVPYRLTRISNTLWRMQAAPFLVYPSAEQGATFATDITLSATSGAITITASAATWLASDVGRQVIADIGTATITGFTSTTIVNATASSFLATFYAAGTWTLTESPKTSCTPSAASTKGGASTLTLAANGWRAADIGKYVAIADGIVEITGFTSALIVTGVVREKLTLPLALIESGAWALEPKSWSATNGYPRAVALHEQRLIMGGSAAYPLNLWATQTGLYLDFSRGVRDAAGFVQAMFGHDMATIMHLVSAPVTLVTLTFSAEMTAGTGNDSALTPTNIHPRVGSINGASACRPVIVNNDVIFIERSGLKVRALAWNFDESALWSPDMTWQSEHITGTGITELAYSKAPRPQLYGVRNDGQMACCALYRQTGSFYKQTGTLDQDVLAWTRQKTEGLYESVASIPYNGADEIWTCVNRTLPAGTKRYIELSVDGVNVDCGLTGTSGPGAQVWGGYGHLEGKTVDVKGDGIAMTPQVVTGGNISAEKVVHTMEAGLHYESTVSIPDIEPIGQSFGGAAVAVHQVLVDMVATVGLEVEGAEVRFFQFGAGMLDQAPPPFTGKKRLPNMGWNGGAITLKQKHPYDWSIRRVIRRYTINEG